MSPAVIGRGPGALPPLSAVESASFEHLNQAAERWRRLTNLWEGAFTEVEAAALRPDGTIYEGTSADALQHRTAVDVGKVRGAVWQLQDAAEVAERGFGDMESARGAVLEAVDEARRDGFTVGDDYTVTDSRTSGTRAQQVSREVVAQEHADYITYQVTRLITTDQDIATRINAATAGLEGTTFEESPVQDGNMPYDGILLVDFRQGPGGESIDGDNQQPRVRGLPPEGVHPPVVGDLTPGPASRPSERAHGGQSLWDENGGEWRYFPGDKWHNPHWDFNPHDTPNSRWDNIPIGDLPHLKENPSIISDPPITLPPLPSPPPEAVAGAGGLAAVGAAILAGLGWLARPFG